jgi:hypothetical protein
MTSMTEQDENLEMEILQLQSCLRVSALLVCVLYQTDDSADLRIRVDRELFEFHVLL